MAGTTLIISPSQLMDPYSLTTSLLKFAEFKADRMAGSHKGLLGSALYYLWCVPYVSAVYAYDVCMPKCLGGGHINSYKLGKESTTDFKNFLAARIGITAEKAKTAWNAGLGELHAEDWKRLKAFLSVEDNKVVWVGLTNEMHWLCAADKMGANNTAALGWTFPMLFSAGRMSNNLSCYTKTASVSESLNMYFNDNDKDYGRVVSLNNKATVVPQNVKSFESLVWNSRNDNTLDGVLQAL